jgi:chromosome partitioning protein
VIRIRGRDDLHKIVVLNPKGGCGKTTLATNLASAFAVRGVPPTLIDCDPQGYCTSWVEKRPSELPEIYGIQCYDEATPNNATIDIDVPPDSDTVIVDMPAAIPHDRLYDYTFYADSLLIPIQASAIDVHSATRFIAELLIDAQLDRREARLGIVANRVRARTKSYERLMRFLTSLKIPMIAALRDSQNFVHAAAAGIGIAEMPAYRVRYDLPQIERIASWLDRRRAEIQSDQADVVRIPTLAEIEATGHGSNKGNEAAGDHLELTSSAGFGIESESS